MCDGIRCGERNWTIERRRGEKPACVLFPIQVAKATGLQMDALRICIKAIWLFRKFSANAST